MLGKSPILDLDLSVGVPIFFFFLNLFGQLFLWFYFMGL